ncbi:hypothetical protein SAMN05428969_2324 [Devosia sp. YR412]|uniref:LPS assembly lipoprotein LptE n=1 Tax=Devosia sp. YR412 TaxID=1881030 RepID=UPI0008AAD5AE|nr:LPS assembly lipoprotein LptE [Devosia sp. YR412]SEQ23296.1 hypothetical protein SAMN05428969_2324 [Devosia sp. YR412]
MSLSKRTRATALAGLMLVSGALLGACSFQPVYSGALAASPTLDIAYAEPTTRLEQIVYQELELRLGSSTSPTAPLATVTVAGSGTGVAPMTSSPNISAPARAGVTATITITRRDGSDAKPLVLSRSATAQYTTTGQVLANTAAANDATERATKAAAESLRLAVLAALSR